MKKILLVVFMLSSAVYLRGQDSLEYKQTSIVTVSLLSPVVSYAPRWTAGYIREINERWLTGIEVAYGTPGLTLGYKDNNDFITDSYRILEIRPEVYLNLRPNRKLKHLLSLELFYLNHQDHFTTDFYYVESEFTDYRYDAADYKRIKTGFNVNYSTLYYFGKRIILWQKVGVGVRKRTVTYSNVVNRSMRNDWDDDGLVDFGMFNYLDHAGSYTGFNFNIDFKIAYTF